MPTDHRSMLSSIRRFDQLVAYLRDEMNWPIARDSFDDVDDLFFDFTPDELCIALKVPPQISVSKNTGKFAAFIYDCRAACPGLCDFIKDLLYCRIFTHQWIGCTLSHLGFWD